MKASRRATNAIEDSGLASTNFLEQRSVQKLVASTARPESANVQKDDHLVRIVCASTTIASTLNILDVYRVLTQRSNDGVSAPPRSGNT
jgi:hypothetical protein